MDEFRKLQQKRDAAAALLVVGAPLLLASIALLVFSVLRGHTAMGWFHYWLGPITLALGLPLFGLGLMFGLSAKWDKNRLDREE